MLRKDVTAAGFAPLTVALRRFVKRANILLTPVIFTLSRLHKVKALTGPADQWRQELQ
jgi:hypothetical protein